MRPAGSPPASHLFQFFMEDFQHLLTIVRSEDLQLEDVDWFVTGVVHELLPVFWTLFKDVKNGLVEGNILTEDL